MTTMQTRLSAVAALAALWAAPAAAELTKVKDRGDFVNLVAGKTLSRPMVEIAVSPDGAISGRGAGWDVTGSWTWQDGYFCRDLYWGGDALGYNCQMVASDGERILFVSDRGSGDRAAFTLN